MVKLLKLLVLEFLIYGLTGHCTANKNSANSSSHSSSPLLIEFKIQQDVRFTFWAPRHQNKSGRTETFWYSWAQLLILWYIVHRLRLLSPKILRVSMKQAYYNNNNNNHMYYVSASFLSLQGYGSHYPPPSKNERQLSRTYPQYFRPRLSIKSKM